MWVNDGCHVISTEVIRLVFSYILSSFMFTGCTTAAKLIYKKVFFKMYVLLVFINTSNLIVYCNFEALCLVKKSA